LKKYFNNLPSLPKKVFGKSDQEAVQRRRVALQHYCRYLVRSPAIQCSALVDFFTQGRKGLVQDPSRVRKKSKHKTREKKSRKSSSEKGSRSPKSERQSLKLSKSRSETISSKRSTERRSSKSKLTNTPPHGRPRAAVSLANQIMIKNASRTESFEQNSWVRSSSPRTPEALKRTFLRSSTDTPTLADVNSMFDSKNEPEPSATLQTDSADDLLRTDQSPSPRKNALKRNSTKFYLSKFKLGADMLEFDVSDDEESDDEELETPLHSDLNFETLGLTDQDLAEFGIGTSSKRAFLDRGVSILDIKELLSEVSEMMSFSDEDEEKLLVSQLNGSS
jgi:hypothetical protein